MKSKSRGAPAMSVVLLLVTAWGTAGAATPAAVPPDADAVERCERLRYLDAAGFEDAPTELTASEAVDAEGRRPAYCRVEGYVSPNIGFELRLPLKDWNGKFFHAGCTGHCGIGAGSGWARECDYPLMRGYACIVSDLGHFGTPGDGLWAWNDLQAKVDFAFRATHRATVAGKAVTGAFYESAPAYSYYMGCSTGGRQGLVSAQRFPWDFDGIIAGAPVVSQAGTSMDFVWNLRHMAGDDGNSLLGEEALHLLHQAALAAGDMTDGLEDGVIGNPAAARFDPGSLLCDTGRSSGCLTSAQVHAARMIYGGPIDARGRKVYPGAGLAPGSELRWHIFAPAPAGRGPAGKSGIDSMRYMVTDWGPEWGIEDFDFDRDYRRLGEGEALYAAGNPDLRAYKRAGGKLLLYQGWADPIIAPMNSLDYYQSVERTMGGREKTQEFFRLFMVPGMNHWFGGKGAFAIDYIRAMERWVEEGVPPDELRAAHLRGEWDASSMIRVFPMDEELEVHTRPVYPWPYRARYGGRGDPDSATSFRPVTD